MVLFAKCIMEIDSLDEIGEREIETVVLTVCPQVADDEFDDEAAASAIEMVKKFVVTGPQWSARNPTIMSAHYISANEYKQLLSE